MKASETPANVLNPSQDSAIRRRNRSGTWIWVILTIVVFGGGGFVLWRALSSGRQSQMQQQGAVPVTLQDVEQETVQQSSGFVGLLDAQRGVVLKPEADGRITRIFVSPGDSVSVGDPILQIDPDRSQAEVSAAQANVSVTRASLNSARAQLSSAEADRNRAEADLALQNEELRRTEFLVEEGAQSEQLLDQAIRNRDTAQATLDAAQEQVRAANAAVEEAIAALNQAQAQAAAVQEDLSYTRVVAPIEGIVGDIPVKLGDYVEIGDDLTTITQNQSLELELSVPIERRDQLRVGLPVELRRFEGDPLVVTGRISFISPQVNAETQSVLAKATFQNTTGQLQDDQRVEARIIWEEQPGVLVPATAVSRLGGQTFVFVAEPQPDASEGEPQLLARQKLITLGELQGNSYQVIDGLEAGETLVVSGILNLSDGTPIAPQDEQAAQPDASPSP